MILTWTDFLQFITLIVSIYLRCILILSSQSKPSLPKSTWEVWKKATGSHPHWMENPYLNLIVGKTPQTVNIGGAWMNPRIRILPLCQQPSWRVDEQGNLLSSGWETILKGRWTTSWSTAWRCRKETGILPHYYFPWKDLKFYIKKEKDKWTP